MKRSVQRLLAACSGVTSLEFALVGPAVMLLVVGIPATGLLLWTKAALQLAASQTARCKAIGSTACTDHDAYVAKIISDWGIAQIVPRSSVSVSALPNQSCNRTAGLFTLVTITVGGDAGVKYFLPFSNVVLNTSACYPSKAT